MRGSWPALVALLASDKRGTMFAWRFWRCKRALTLTLISSLFGRATIPARSSMLFWRRRKPGLVSQHLDTQHIFKIQKSWNISQPKIVNECPRTDFAKPADAKATAKSSLLYRQLSRHRIGKRILSVITSPASHRAQLKTGRGIVNAKAAQLSPRMHQKTKHVESCESFQ